VVADDLAFVQDLLGDSLAKGTPITINAAGQRRAETLEIFRGVIENLSEVERWIKQRGLNISDPQLVHELIDFVRGRAQEHAIIAPRSCIHKLLNSDSIVLNRSVCSKEQAIQELATVHALRVQVADTRIYGSVWDREEDGSTLWPGGVALPHARLAEGPEHVHLAVGIYPAGVKWITGAGFCPQGDNTAYAVFMFLCGPEAQDEYVDYLGQLARLFRRMPGLVRQLRDVQNASQVVRLVRNAEDVLWVV
jgi:mannitol/fructose-specific phosphotransferase system IIA component (Ntr-type)